MESDASSRVLRARSLNSSKAAADLYAEWASTYDRDVFEVMRVTGSYRIAELLHEYVADRGVEILDLGCGTGVVGVRLAALGFSTIDGADLSPAMLSVAADTGVYRELVVMDLNSLTPTGQGPRYGASVSAGTFTTGHVGPESVPGIAEMLLPGAVVAWVIAQSLWDSFATALRTSGFEVLHQTLEAIRVDGPRESMMVVARHR